MGLIKKCCVGGCSATNETHRLFSFPKNDNLGSLWMSFLVPTTSALIGLSKQQLVRKHVCEKHFDKYQFDQDGKRLRKSYPCLFTDDEIKHGVPLSSSETDRIPLSDHNYYSENSNEHLNISDEELVIGKGGFDNADKSGPDRIINENDLGNTLVWSPAPSIADREPIQDLGLEPTVKPEPMLEAPVRLDKPVEQPVPETGLVEQVSTGESADPELDPELLEALGESTSDTPEFGLKIHENLAKLWLPLLVKGLPKEKKKKMLKEYLIPDNCRLLQAPKLNAEISAAISDSTRNRDKILIAHQQQLGSGITAVNRALDILLSGDDKRKEVVHHLSNACRLLSDLHTINTNSRIKLITPNLEKNFLHVVQDSVRDDTLFGNKLSEKIKAAKAIERQGQQIKKTNPRPSGSQSNNSRSYNPGNWSGPPRYSSNRGSRGGKRTTKQNRRPYPNPTHNQPASKPAIASKPRAPAP